MDNLPTTSGLASAPGTELVFDGDASPEAPLLWESEGEEWAFRVDGLRAIRPPAVPGLADYLQQRIAAEPYHLLHHTQRIALEYQLNHPEALYGALLDLFIVLGARGRALRQRMASSVRARLSPEHYGQLSLWLDRGRTLDADSAPPLPFTLFGLGLVDALPLLETVEDAASAPPDERDPLVEARECIEYSQIDQARQILESAVLAQPERADLQCELLELYRAQRDASHFLKLYPTFVTKENPLAEDWRATARFLNVNENR
jgi:hypothetical protein